MSRERLMLWMLVGLSAILGISSFLFRLGRQLRAMGSKLVIGAFILMVIAVLIAAIFLFFDPTVFYPKLSPSPR